MAETKLTTKEKKRKNPQINFKPELERVVETVRNAPANLRFAIVSEFVSATINSIKESNEQI